jgi:O-antigen ligase
MTRAYKNIIWLGLAALLIFSPVARGTVRIWSITIFLLVELSLVFIWLWKVTNSDKYTFRKTGLGVPIVIFMVLAVISFIFSIYKNDSFYALLRLSGYIGIYYLVVNEFDHKMRRRLEIFVICAGTGLSLYGLLQYFGFLNHDWWEPQKFLASTYVNHNHFAGYIELVIPLAVGMLFSSWRKKQISKAILFPALIVMLTAFILSQSRGAWFSLAVSFLIIGALFVRRKAFNAQTIFTIFLVMIVIFSFIYFGKDIIYSRIDSVSIVKGEEPSANAHLKIWQGTVEMIRSNPITGVGIGDFIWRFPRFRPEGLNAQANFAHNDYLQTAAEMGVPASLVMIWLLAAIIAGGIKRSDSDPVKIGCAIGLLSLSLHGLVDFNFHIPANMLLFTVYAAIVSSISRSNDES